MVKHVVKPNSRQNKKPCKPNVHKAFRVRPANTPEPRGYRLADLAKPSRIVALRPAGCTAPLRCTLVPAASSATGSAVGTRPGPEGQGNRFSNALRPFPPLFARAKMLLCTLSSVVSICSGSVCGQICGRDYGAAVGMQ